jgi:radical SAM protein with 4Fe4S-binding SPASM domain
MAVTRNIRWSVGIGYTSKCNMSCPFCYSKQSRKTQRELPLSLWQDFFCSNHVMIECVNYGTGENTLAPAWFDLVRFVRDRFPAIRQAVTSNGYLVEAIKDPRKKEAFLAGIDEVDVSLDFADQAKHNTFRGNADAYRMARETLELCARYGKEATLVLIGLDETLALVNVARLFEIARQTHAFIRINIYRPYPGQNLRPPKFETVTRCLEWIFANHEIVSLSDPLFNALYNYHGSERRDPSGTGSLRILPGGDITPSTYLISPAWFAGKIWEENVLKRLPSTAPFQALRNAPVPQVCLTCYIVDKCRGGPYDRRILTYGTLQQRDPYCPAREGRRVVPRQYDLHFYDDGPTIHAGYLPTLIFKST